MKRLLLLALVGVLLAASTDAAIPPVKIERGGAQEHSVDLVVYDPHYPWGLHFFYNSSPAVFITNFTITGNGIAYWVEQTGDLFWFRYAIYDPGFSDIVLGSSPVLTDFVEASLQEKDGVVSCWGQDWGIFPDKVNVVSYSTYDPIRGEWVTGNSKNFQSILLDPMLVNQNGIVAFYYEVVTPTPDWAVLGYIYDYTRHSWREGIFKLSTSFSIDQLSIKFIVGGDTMYRGYNPIEGGVWQSGHTRNKSFFSVYPNSGKKPLWVSFWDLSIGALPGSDWTFGDGESAPLASLNHRYQTGGIYVAYQNVIGIYGSDWTKTNIYVSPLPGSTGNLGFLHLLLLE